MLDPIMRVKLVTLRYASSLGGFDERPLSDFVRDKEILAVREHFWTLHDLRARRHLHLCSNDSSTCAWPAPMSARQQKAKGRGRGSEAGLACTSHRNARKHQR